MTAEEAFRRVGLLALPAADAVEAQEQLERDNVVLARVPDVASLHLAVLCPSAAHERKLRLKDPDLRSEILLDSCTFGQGHHSCIVGVRLIGRGLRRRTCRKAGFDSHRRVSHPDSDEANAGVISSIRTAAKLCKPAGRKRP